MDEQEITFRESTPAEGATPLPEETPVTDSAPPTEPEPQPEAATDDTGTPEPKGVGKRIDELTRNWREEQRRNDQLLALIQQLQQKPEETPKAEPVAAAEPPKLEQFDYDEAKYQAALIEYTRAEARREVETLLARKEAENAERAKAQTFEKRQAEFLAKRPDYAEKVLRDVTLPISPTMAEVIKESEAGPELAYYLAENRELAAQIAKLPERAAARELGRIEAKLEAQREAVSKPPAAAPTAPPKPKVSEAPPPPPKIEATETDTAPVSAGDPDSDKLSWNEWLKRREKEVAKSRKR